MHLHKQLLRFVVIIGVFTQILWSMDHREKSKADLYQAIVDGNVELLRTAITNIDAFNPNDLSLIHI